MSFAIGMLLGLFIGGTIGMLAMALATAAKDTELDFEDEYDDINRKYIALLEHWVFGDETADEHEDDE